MKCFLYFFIASLFSIIILADPINAPRGYLAKGISALHEKKYDAYDFIIVGGGTAGCVLAEQLSRNEEFLVLLIEGGFEHEKEWAEEYRDPVKFSVQEARGHCLGTYFDGYLRLAVQGVKPARGVLTKFGFSEALGGFSAINDQIVTRGSQESWNAIGNGLDWKSVLPYFRKVEKKQNKPNALPVREVKDTIARLFNQSVIEDYNSGNPSGLSEAQYAVAEFGSSSSYLYGKRETTYGRFLENTGALKRANLVVMSGTKVTKIIVDGAGESKRAAGVIINSQNGPHTIKAHKEVILCAGALNTPLILQQSGIGSLSHLQSLGISCAVEVPGVGKNLHDHLYLGNILFKDTTTYPAGYRPPQLLLHAHSLVNSVEPINTPDLEYIFTPSIPDHLGRTNWLVDICVTRHALRGQLAATSKVPGVPPAFPVSPHLPYTQGSDDFLPEIKPLLVKAIRLLEPLLDSTVLRYEPRPIGDDFKQIALIKNQTDEQILDQFRYFFKNATIENLNAIGASIFVAHRFGGTCKIGDLADPQTVVDKNFKVRGFDNLRVCDASIIPFPIQSHMDVPMMMLGSKLGSTLSKEHKDTYDFIVVGSGCAGTVLLSRLSENPNVTVLCIDAGDYHPSFDDQAKKINGRTLDNLLPAQAIIDHLGNWQRYHPSQFGFGLTAPNQNYNNRIRNCIIFGGGSVINSSDYWRGCKWVFDYWASPTGLDLKGWSWDEVAPFHEIVEFVIAHNGKELAPVDPKQWPGRGMQGRLAIETLISPLTDPSQPCAGEQIAAALEMPFYKDYQVPHHDEKGTLVTKFVSYKQHNDTRVVTGYCDDVDVFERENLTILLKTPVARVIFDTKQPHVQLTVLGVVTHDGTVYRARKEVIINCGAINTPKLLMLSGIGDAQELSKVGVTPMLNLPGVGKNLADHISPHLEGFSTTMLSNYGVHKRQQVKVLLQTHPNTFNNWPDVEVAINYNIKPDTNDSWVIGHTYGHLGPVKGEMRLRSQDPSVGVEISGVHEVFDTDGNIRADIASQWIGIYRMWLKLFINLKGVAQGSVRYSQTTLFVRDAHGQVKTDPTDEEIIAVYKTAVTNMPSLFRYKSVYDKGHFMGTCRMGNRKKDKLAVVDNHLLVHGTSNLRVTDNSFIPSTPDGKTVVSPFGHPSAWLYMIGEKTSAYLKKKYAL